VPETDFPETTVVGVERAAREHAFFELDLHQIDCAVSIVFNAAGKREGRHVGAGRETTPEVVSSADSTRPSFSQEPVPEPSVSASASPRKVTHQSNGRDDALMAKEPKKLDELFHDTLKDIYFAEKKILSA
jgi:hypothetical protein